MERFFDKVRSFGTEGLTPEQARRINVVTIASLIAIPLVPSYSVFYLFWGFAWDSWAVLSSFGYIVLYFIPLALVGMRAHVAAKVVGSGIINGHILLLGYQYGAESGVHLYFILAGLVAFLVYGRSEGRYLALFTVLPAVFFLIVHFGFTEFWPPMKLDEEILERLFVLNFLSSFGVICLITYIFYDLVQRAEQRLTQFSVAVSEYLDGALVERLRDGADVGPRVCDLTVFFSDLVGSTRISFAMGEEAYGSMINSYVREMQAIIKSRGGYLEDISGDGILGYFGNFETAGAQRDAIAAVATARDMTARLAELVPRFKREFGLPEDLYVRIGISSGAALVGKTEGVRAIYTANGDVVNLGAKLESNVRDISATGGILISEATAKLVAGEFDLERHQIDVEGEPMTAFAVAAA